MHYRLLPVRFTATDIVFVATDIVYVARLRVTYGQRFKFNCRNHWAQGC